MKTLIVASTQLEVNKYLNSYCLRSPQKNVFYNKLNNNIAVLISGIGIVNMASELSLFLANNNDFKLVINIGIGGCFDKNINFGQLFFIDNDYLPEIGVLNKIDDISEFPIELFDHNPLTPSKIDNVFNINPKLFSTLEKLKKYSALTVNSCTNNQERAEYFKNKYSAMIESMEGYAFFEVCSKFDVSYFQIRANSNLIPQKNKADWNMQSALLTIDEFLIENFN